MTQTKAAQSAIGRQDRREDVYSRFYVIMAVILLAVTLGGFARTFFLKPLFQAPELPWHLHAYGVVLTGWFMVFLVQSVLVATGRPATHRRLGVLAVGLAVFLVAMTFHLILGVSASTEPRGVTRHQPIEVIVLGDLAVLTAFCLLVSFGFKVRRIPAKHIRAMLFASIAIVVPALTRLGRVWIFDSLGSMFLPVAVLSLMAAVWIHDWLAEGRVHATTIWGSALIFGGILMSGVLARTDLGKEIVAAISIQSA